MRPDHARPHVGSLTLWTGAVAAVLNAVVLANLVVLTGDQVAALNGAVFAVLALVAANAAPRTPISVRPS